jgi:hypothetical protein
MVNSGKAVYDSEEILRSTPKGGRFAGPGGTEFLERNALEREQKPVEAFSLRMTVENAHRRLCAERTSSARMAHEVAVVRRRQFWSDTCRKPSEMRMRSAQALSLHRSYGCRFSSPSLQQVQGVLNALDGALPSWERDHPELFFQTLELNFPELLTGESTGFPVGPRPSPLT